MPRRKRYSVIVVDPPWPTIKKVSPVFQRVGRTGIGFPLMSLEQIRNIPIQSILLENGSVFLWTIQRFLRDAFGILDAWGVPPKLTLTWDKTSGMSIFGWHRCSEFVIWGSCGSWGALTPRGKTICTVIREKATGLCVKPDLFYDEVARKFPGPRLDMFARKRRKGWDAFGDQVSGSIAVDRFPGGAAKSGRRG